ncbi:MAG: shikimate kinase [Thermodesulfobacteriota bacterium]
MKIILVGYRACGKTTVGRLVARRLGLDFVDLDREIEASCGCSIRELVAAQGWETFRARERELLARSIGRENLVLATGGGAILHQEVWPRLMASGLVIWLDASHETIVGRLQRDAATAGQRPSLTGAGVAEEVAAVLAVRTPLYQAGCHLRLDTDGLPVAAIVDRIVAVASSWPAATVP